MKKNIELTLPVDSKFISVVRLTTSGIATKLGFSTSAIEDIKVAISEACNNIILYAYPENKDEKTINIVYTLNNKSLTITVKDTGIGFDHNNPAKREITDTDIHMGLGLEFVDKLMDSSKIKSIKGEGTTVTMTKNIT